MKLKPFDGNPKIQQKRLWGMNFDDMPELHMKYGYTMFWLLVIGLTVFSSVGMKLSGMFDKL